MCRWLTLSSRCQSPRNNRCRWERGRPARSFNAGKEGRERTGGADALRKGRYHCMFRLMVRSAVFAILIWPVRLAAPLAAQEVKFDSDTISGLGARNIGSATMSGRVAVLAAVKENGR